MPCSVAVVIGITRFCFYAAVITMESLLLALRLLLGLVIVAVGSGGIVVGLLLWHRCSLLLYP